MVCISSVITHLHLIINQMNPLNDKSGLKVGLWNVNRLPEEKSKGDFFLK